MVCSVLEKAKEVSANEDEKVPPRRGDREYISPAFALQRRTSFPAVLGRRWVMVDGARMLLDRAEARPSLARDRAWRQQC
jgi:hypothetical protein